MLEIDNLHVFYDESYILQGASLCLQSERILALLGRNGVGKTTLARSIMGLSRSRSGKITFRNRDIGGWLPYQIAREGIGYVPQGRQLFPSLTIREHLQISARGNGEWNVDSIVELFPNLGRRFNNYAGTLSGGEQQMLTIARALMTNPKMVIMDEPTEGLAPLVVKELGRIIESMKERGTSILLIEQQLGFALRHADSVAIMSKGRIVHRCSPQELKDDREIKARYLGI